MAHSVFFFVFLCFALSFVIALVSPAINSIISDISPDVEKGEITGFYYGMFFLGGAAGPIIFGIIADTIGLDSIFLISAAIAFELFAIVFFFRKQIIE